MKKYIEANDTECLLSVQKTTIYIVGSSARLEQRTGETGVSVQVVGGVRIAERRGSAIEEGCWLIIKDPPEYEEGHYRVGPVSKKSFSLRDGIS